MRGYIKKGVFNMSVGAIVLTFAICYVPIMVIFAIMPHIGRRTLTFGVSIPSSVHDDKRLREMRKSFSFSVIVIGLIICTLSVIPHLLWSSSAAVGVMTGLVFVYIIIIFGVYVSNFKKVKSIKEQEGWAVNVPVKSVADTKFSHQKRSVSALWFLLYIVIIAATLAAGILLYDQMPDKVIMQSDYDGNPTRMVEKSFKLIMFAPAIQAVMALLMGFVYWMMLRTPAVIDPEQPEISTVQNAKFRYRWSAFIVFLGMLLLLIFLFMQLTFLGIVPQSLVVWVPMVAAGGMVVAAIILSVTTGQSGSRIRVGKQTDGKTINRNDEKYWKGGLFYVNKNDPALFVEKRFGVGFTINFGRPLAIVIFVGILAIIAAVAILSSVLAE